MNEIGRCRCPWYLVAVDEEAKFQNLGRLLFVNLPMDATNANQNLLAHGYMPATNSI